MTRGLRGGALHGASECVRRSSNLYNIARLRVFTQMTVAILILVGFESVAVTAMGGEAKYAKRDIPIAVLAFAAGPGRDFLLL